MDGHPDAAAGLADDVHAAQHGFVAEILEADPEAARRHVVLADPVFGAVVGVAGGEDGR